MVKISNASYENEIHRVDSPFKEDSKNILYWQGRPNFGVGTAGKWPKTEKSIVMQIREQSILIGNTGLYSLVSKSLHYFQLVFLHVRSNYLLKTEKVSFQAKF